MQQVASERGQPRQQRRHRQAQRRPFVVQGAQRAEVFRQGAFRAAAQLDFTPAFAAALA
jgi:hypothetical protein